MKKCLPTIKAVFFVSLILTLTSCGLSAPISYAAETLLPGELEAAALASENSGAEDETSYASPMSRMSLGDDDSSGGEDNISAYSDDGISAYSEDNISAYGEDGGAAMPDSETESENTVFWLEGGTVWHKSLSCPSLKGKENILSGTEQDAIAAGKEHLCKRCGD
ncbi:MAG: hypothetical protein ACI4QZ_02665 [Eubacteriales bacterium]